VLTVYHYLRGFPADDSPLNAGMEKAVGGLAGGMTGLSDVKSVVLCEHPGVERTFQRNDGYTVRSFDNATTDKKMFGLAPSLKRFVTDELAPQAAPGEAIVILNSIFHPSVFLLSRLFRKHGIPYIAAPHDPYHPSIFGGKAIKKKLYWYLCERPMLRRANAIQVLDRRHEAFLRDLGVTTPVIEVINGFAPSDVPDESALRFRNDDDDSPTKILFLGRLDRENKGLDLLIDAFAQLGRDDVRLTLQGPDRGDRASLQEQIARLNLADRVNILDADYTAKSSDLAMRHDVFVLPSRFEGFGLSALEAMLAARPVLISDVAGLAPHVKAANAGVVVAPSVDSIRTGLQELLSRRSEWRDLGTRARAYVLQHLAWQPIDVRAISEYQKIVGK
jgi:glycosyltransferase involved in cell wall biosynthesis